MQIVSKRMSLRTSSQAGVAISIERTVIANQPSGWCGDPLDRLETFGNCHVALLLAMTIISHLRWIRNRPGIQCYTGRYNFLCLSDVCARRLCVSGRWSHRYREDFCGCLSSDKRSIPFYPPSGGLPHQSADWFAMTVIVVACSNHITFSYSTPLRYSPRVQAPGSKGWGSR